MANGGKLAQRLPAALCGYWPPQSAPHQHLISVTGPARPLNQAFQHAEEYRAVKFEYLQKGLLGQTFAAIATACPTCRACVPLRVNLEKFSPRSKRLRSLLNPASALKTAIVPAHLEPELFGLFQRYTKARHGDVRSMMRNMSLSAFRDFVHAHTHMALMHYAKDLTGFVLLDLHGKEMSFDYAVYEPDPKQSYGKLLWIRTMMEAQKKDIEHVYVGAWAKGSPKLDYKRHHSGLETLVDGEWVNFDPEVHVTGPDYRAILKADGLEPG